MRTLPHSPATLKVSHLRIKIIKTAAHLNRKEMQNSKRSFLGKKFSENLQRKISIMKMRKTFLEKNLEKSLIALQKSLEALQIKEIN